MRRVLSTAAALLCVLALGTACGDDDDPGGSTEVTTIEVTVDGDSVTPAGDRIEVEVGQPVDLVVSADGPGEIHVHSEPEQEFEYTGGGAPETFELQIDRPGVVEIESHTLEALIVSLEVK